jgi:hypothetical protein
MAPRLRSAVVRFDALPEPVLRVLFLALPVDARARAACVCRSWRAFLADPSLWQVLDLTPAGGVAAERLTLNLIRGASRRAAGQLRSFSLNHAFVPNFFDMPEWLVNLVWSDGAQLQQVNTDLALNVAQLDRVFAAAPRLQVLNASVSDTCAALIPVLRNDAPYGPLRISALSVGAPGFLGNGPVDPADMLALAAAVAAHESLKDLSIRGLQFAPGLKALVDVAAERRVSSLSINDCALDADTVPALARLLQRGSLTRLTVSCNGFPSAQEESVPVLSAALRSCRTLTHLLLMLVPLHGATHRTVTELLDAAASLPALSELDLSDSRLQDTTAFGRTLGALLAANLPSLRTLRVTACGLGDEGVGPLLDGLAANTHLRELNCFVFNDLSEAFERDQLAPALTAVRERRHVS